MSHRPYPDRERTLRHQQRGRAHYLYGRFPQRYALGMTSEQACAVLTSNALLLADALEIRVSLTSWQEVSHDQA